MVSAFRIGQILSVCLSVPVPAALFLQPPFSMIFMKNSFAFSRKIIQKGGPGRHTTPTVTRFRTGHLAEVIALSSNGDCGATPLSVCLVATLVTMT